MPACKKKTIKYRGTKCLEQPCRYPRKKPNRYKLSYFRVIATAEKAWKFFLKNCRETLGTPPKAPKNI